LIGGGVAVDALGPDLYLFGEETGLEEVIEGRPPLPRVARPFIQGLFARPPAENPTLVNNVETLANVPHILAHGPDWLRTNGTQAAPGTMVFTICGDVRREGVFELPLGSPLRYLVEELAGGPPDGQALKAIFPGASNTAILPEQLDLPLDFDAMRQARSGLGAGGFAVFDDSACLVQAAWRSSRFLFVESCGQCPACKLRTGEVTQTLQALEGGARLRHQPSLDPPKRTRTLSCLHRSAAVADHRMPHQEELPGVGSSPLRGLGGIGGGWSRRCRGGRAIGG